MHKPRLAKTGNLHTLSRYWAYTEKPRPESYREDLDTAKEFCNKFCDTKDSKEKTDRLRADLFRDIASAAESGHDFSSRWFEDRQSIRTIRTTKIVPADLNGFMYKMERDIAWLARQLEQNVESVDEVEYAQELAAQFEITAETRRTAIYEVMWDDSEKRAGATSSCADQNSICTTSTARRQTLFFTQEQPLRRSRRGVRIFLCARPVRIGLGSSLVWCFREKTLKKLWRRAKAYANLRSSTSPASLAPRSNLRTVGLPKCLGTAHPHACRRRLRVRRRKRSLRQFCENRSA